jgi:hypothetical protein
MGGLVGLAGPIVEQTNCVKLILSQRQKNGIDVHQ